MMSWHSFGLRFCGMVELPTVPGGTGSSGRDLNDADSPRPVGENQRR
jgi:hypothetical protein